MQSAACSLSEEVHSEVNYNFAVPLYENSLHTPQATALVVNGARFSSRADTLLTWRAGSPDGCAAPDQLQRPVVFPIAPHSCDQHFVVHSVESGNATIHSMLSPGTVSVYFDANHADYPEFRIADKGQRFWLDGTVLEAHRLGFFNVDCAKVRWEKGDAEPVQSS
ncbi:MAG TPA: hypothetical protein VME18_00105 [Acidobacteriaceae bacterium]|nr:hypothetical protein [Acidobacteriaceae bacterium]